MVILFFLLGVSAKHLREDVSTTVSQNVTTGSATWEIKQIVEMKFTFARRTKFYLMEF
jgi:hypothetical protein